MLRSVPACLTARYVEALPPLNALSVVNRRFPPHCASIQLGNRPADTAWANKQDCRPCDFLPRSATDETPPWGPGQSVGHFGGRGRADSKSPSGPARLPSRLATWLLRSSRTVRGQRPAPDADLEGRRDHVRERTRQSRGPQHRQPVGDLASDRVGPVGAVRRTHAGDLMATPTALLLDAPAGA